MGLHLLTQPLDELVRDDEDEDFGPFHRLRDVRHRHLVDNADIEGFGKVNTAVLSTDSRGGR